MTKPVLDPTALGRLQRIGGDRLVRAMMGSFLENGALRVAAARAGAGNGDAQEVSDAAHALKSSAGNVGAESLRLVAQKVERESLEAGAPLDALASELEQAFAEASVAAAAARDAAGPA